jgi:integrase/recombinase XerD
MDRTLIGEFVLDWKIAGKAKSTAADYSKHLEALLVGRQDPTLREVRDWLVKCESISVRRKRAQAVRAFGNWAGQHGYGEFSWWREVPVARESVKPQKTASEHDYKSALHRAKSNRDKALIEVLWSCGLRRSEIARLEIHDINFSVGFLVVRTTKTRRPRIAPMSPTARHAMRRLVGKRESGSLFQMTPNAIRLCLQRLKAPSAHAWRRGWAVQSLRSGVSEASVRAVAGLSSGAMVTRYTQALSGELSIEEFQRSWGQSR